MPELIDPIVGYELKHDAHRIRIEALDDKTELNLVPCDAFITPMKGAILLQLQQATTADYILLTGLNKIVARSGLRSAKSAVISGTRSF